MGSKKQTVSFLKRRFGEAGFQPHSKHGQNFLIDLNLLDLIVRAADIGPQDVVLEVGTGTGSLTARLVEKAGAVVTVEIDPHLASMAEEQLAGASNVVILKTDALHNKNRLKPELVETVQQQLQQIDGAQLKLCANLPYSVATPIISNLLGSEIVPYSMTVTIQKELAERIVATHGNKDYGSLSIWVQCQSYAAILRELAPTVFWPRPKVDSAIVQIVVDPNKRERISDLDGFHQFLRGLFMHRRKFLRGSLVSQLKQFTKADIDEIMQQLGFGAETRAEQLDVDQVIRLYDAVAQRDREVNGSE